MLDAKVGGNRTHEVVNQAPPFVANLFDIDPAFRQVLASSKAAWAAEDVRALGATAGSEETTELARLANLKTPELKSHDRFGNRIDMVEFHPAYHDLMHLAFGAGVHSKAWTEEGRGGSHVARAALSYVWQQAETGVACTTAMAYACVPTMRHAPDLWKAWERQAFSTSYDPRPIWFGHKTGATIGMAMTEKHGGSDLRSNSTTAKWVGSTEFGDEYVLTGHKWFCSAPMSDAFLTLAQTDHGITCFFVFRTLLDGSRNTFLIQRLKDKLGNRSNASSEVEYDGTRAIRVGEEGRGISVLIEMAHLTRLDVSIGSSSIMRRALVEAIHHARHRRAFQKTLVDQPMMAGTLAELAVESEAMMMLVMRAASAVDRANHDPADALIGRLIVPAAKFFICKRTSTFVAEALECHGGNGFVETGIMPRLFREAPLNSLWEGSGNVICLDVLRALRRHPEAMDAVMKELRFAQGHDRAFDKLVDGLPQIAELALSDEGYARTLAEHLALTMQGALLIRSSPSVVSDAFCATALTPRVTRSYGSSRIGSAQNILDRALAG